MFKSRRKLVRKCAENGQITDRGIGRNKKLEGNLNITTKRLTIPPGFLCLGIKSGTIQKSEGQEESNTQKDYILKEDLHNLFNNNLNDYTRKPRRSTRISKKVEKSRDLDNATASDYYSKVFPQEHNPQHNRNPELSPFRTPYSKNNSKSLFLKINRRYAKATNCNTLDFIYPIRPIISSNNNIEHFQNSLFCKNLSNEICIDLKDDNPLLKCKFNVSKKIQIINDILCGKIKSSEDMFEDENNQRLDTDKGQEVHNFELIPRCNWIYETPPRQRITLPRVEACAIQPAIICTTKKQSNIYELNSNIKVDLTNCTNRQNVNVDRRYLRHLASFDDKMQLDFGIDSLEPRGNENCQVKENGHGRGGVGNNFAPNQKEKPNEEFNFASRSVNESDYHFMSSAMSRPTKTIPKTSRINKTFKRKLDDFDTTPTSSNNQQTNEQFEREFTFIEENGKYTMVNTQTSSAESEFDFQFKKNLFKVCEGENLFSFNKKEPKMFDFSQLKRDNC